MNNNIKRGVWVAATLLGCLGLAVSAQGASFECGKAGTKVEHIICDDPEISKLDDKLGHVYQDVLGKANEEQKQQVISEQKHWLKYTRNACEKITCLKHAYWSRQAALETWFEPRSPLYEHESDKAEVVKEVLATAPLYPLYDKLFCSQIFDDLKQMKGIRFVDPVVQVQSYEDPALDPWKKNCLSVPPFNFAYWCDRNIEAADADDVAAGCNVGYGLPPFKLYELPQIDSTGEKRYFFYADEKFGPMNRDWRKPALGGAGLAGFQQINITQCMSARNLWVDGGGKKSSWRGVFIDAGQGDLNGKNYNSIIEYKNQYYFFVLHERHGSYSLDIEPVVRSNFVCRWSPIKQ